MIIDLILLLTNRSPKWDLVSNSVKSGLGVSQKVDGEFWMNFKDFCQYFTRVYICTLGPDFDQDGIVDQSKYCMQPSYINLVILLLYI